MITKTPVLSIADIYILVYSAGIIMTGLYFFLRAFAGLKEAEAFAAFVSSTKKNYKYYFGKMSLKKALRNARKEHLSRGQMVTVLQKEISEETQMFKAYKRKCQLLPTDVRKELEYTEVISVIKLGIPVKAFRMWAEEIYIPAYTMSQTENTPNKGE